MKQSMKRFKTRSKRPAAIAVLCSGGDAPGMNAAVRAVVRAALHEGLDVFGVIKGYSGLLEGSLEPMNLRSVANIIQRGGTIIKTDRCKAFFQKASRAEAVHILRRKGIDGLVVVGGEGSFTGAYLMEKENDFPVVGIPGTIDNDVYGSEYTIGFDTAVNTALSAIDKIRDTASSHDRVFHVEVMGRLCSEIAVRVGVSGGAETVLVPEDAPEHTLSALIANLRRSAKLGKLSSIVIVPEGGRLGSANDIARKLRQRAKIDSRVAILGHVQRGGSPSAMDRFMASLMGYEAVQLLLRGESNCAVGVVGGKIAAIPFHQIIGRHKKTDRKLLKLAEILAS